MNGSRVLQSNMNDVNRLLLRVSAVGITLLYGLCFGLIQYGLLEMEWPRYWLAVGVTYAIFGLTLLLYRISRLRRLFHYIFPVEIYLTVGIGVYLFGSPASVHFIWLIPVIYAGLYAIRGPILFLSALVLVTSAVEALLVRPGGWQQNLGDVLTASVIMLIVMMRIISLVNRSRAMIEQTEEEMNHNAELKMQNERLLHEVSATVSEMGTVVRQLTEMSEGMRVSINQIASGSEQIVSSSQQSQQVMRQNRQLSQAQQEEAEKVGEAVRSSVDFAGTVQKQAVSGEEVVERIAVVIDRIDHQSSETATLTERLFGRTDEITDCSQAITSIAKNVGVVAINASIEAARAGAAGRTFQVVAEQVQMLARQAEQAASAIGELAERVRADLDQIRTNMQESRNVVRQGVSVAQEAREKLRMIGSAVDDIHLLLSEVANIAARQLQSSATLTTGMETLYGQTELSLRQLDETAAATEETAAIMDEFAVVVRRLRERANRLEQLFDKKIQST
ncbi:methyl-accepting chemotaxis protein [Brevibacillus humidisoli]|uniref:methyl-accepting chemotaxis protein n=1 Tax=Brevibacillus humidisoli TaxID=2895522 RepID=UPI001E2E2F13|nr:methyl-accepting chemotaxis protein [Brevibacillus humidisoli]UFJ39761.1 methyl-accepting chemotaxis protein [Brevibacillus humidisoli]